MLYKPKYCCNCGEKIERSEWKLWNSRRFCELCETEHKGIDMIPRVLVGAGFIAGVFGMGSFLEHNSSAEPSSGDVRVSAVPSSRANDFDTKGSNTDTNAKPVGLKPIAPTTVGEGTSLHQETTEQPTASKLPSDEPVFYCGAMTKKGTPCTRRVKNKGRCWQHATAEDAKQRSSAPARF